MNRRVRLKIVKGELYEQGSSKIEWARLASESPQGLVFAPPLIGGSFIQQIRLLRWMSRIGFDVFSFNYFGHGNSSGKFSLRKSLKNTVSTASQVSQNNERRRTSLVGFAGCYSAIPLLFAAKKLGEPFERIVLINPLFDLKPVAVMRSFFLYYKDLLVNSSVKRNIGAALKRYADFLFPQIQKDRDSFGVLKRNRTSLMEVLLDFFLLSPLKGVTLTNTPVFCLYSRKDRILDVYRFRRRLYEESVRKICPLVRFEAYETDHFFRSAQTRKHARQTITSFLSRPFSGDLEMAV